MFAVTEAECLQLQKLCVCNYRSYVFAITEAEIINDTHDSFSSSVAEAGTHPFIHSMHNIPEVLLLPEVDSCYVRSKYK